MDKFEFELIILDWKNTLNVNFFYETKTLPQKTSVGFICIHFSQLKRIYTGIRCFYLIFIGTVKKRTQTKCETKEKFILFSELFFASTK